MNVQFPAFESSRLLVHIAFHYNARRLVYLNQVLAAIADYSFASIEVVIDTNSPEFDRSALPEYPGLTIAIDVHTELTHPFMLTWTHRPDMRRRLNDFDYFMYVEDDMEVSHAALLRWRSDSEYLYPRGYLRGFLRTETDADGVLVSTDQLEANHLQFLKCIDGRLHYLPRNPYQAFWIYSRQQMQTFIDTPCWRDGNIDDWGIRERAAAGMIWRDRARHRCVIPLDEDHSIPPDVLVAHLPNNYALDPEEDYGKLPIASLTELEPLAEWIKRIYLFCWRRLSV